MLSLSIHLMITILAIWYFTRPYRKDAESSSEDLQKEEPLEILDKRFANGEIDQEEYEKRKVVLGKD